MISRHDNKIAILISQIRKRREMLHLTQYELALRAGIRQANYSRMESGKQTPNLETLLRILDVLQLDFRLSNADETVYHIMYRDETVTDVILSADRKRIRFIKYAKDGWKQPFSGSRLDLARFYRFLKSRCYEDGRADLDEILKKAGFSDNNPYDWVALTHGVTYDDDFWIRMSDETTTWEEVRVR